MKCKKCQNNLFKIQPIKCCDDCSENGAWDEDLDNGNGDWTYDIKVIEDKGLERTQVSENAECRVDSAYGSGCYMFYCSKCNHKTNIAFSDHC